MIRWVRISVAGNKVTAQLWASSPDLGGAPAYEGTYMLTGGDATTWGAGVAGRGGWAITPGNTTQSVDNFRVDPIDADLFAVRRSLDGGTTWEWLRTAEGIAPNGETWGQLTPTSGRATAWDFEAPNGADVVYEAVALHSYGGLWAASTGASRAGRWTSAQEWLVHPSDPSKTMQIRIVESSAREREARQGYTGRWGAQPRSLSPT